MERKTYKPPKSATMHTAAREYVRKRDSADCPPGAGRCQCCGRIMGFSGLQCAHLLDGRGKARLAYDPDNLALLCVVEGKYPNGCHRWLDDHPLDMHKFLVDYMGEEKLEEMHQKSLESGRRTPEEKWEILDELNKMRKQL